MQHFNSKFAKVIVVTFLITIFISLAADDVEKLIEEGRQAYLEEDFKQAHQLLQKAVAAISKNITDSFKPFLPDAPAGWKKGKVTSNTTSMSSDDGNARITEAECTYEKIDSQADLQIYITNSPQINKPFKQMSENFAMMKGVLKQQGMDVKKENGWFIVLEPRSDSNYELTAVQESIVIKIQQAPNKQDAETFFDSIDLDGLLEAPTNKNEKSI